MIIKTWIFAIEMIKKLLITLWSLLFYRNAVVNIEVAHTFPLPSPYTHTVHTHTNTHTQIYKLAAYTKLLWRHWFPYDVIVFVIAIILSWYWDHKSISFRSDFQELSIMTHCSRNCFGVGRERVYICLENQRTCILTKWFPL